MKNYTMPRWIVFNIVWRCLSVVLLLFSLTVLPSQAQSTREVLLSADDGYNPIPSPNGAMIAYVRTDWRQSGIVGLSRGYMVPEVMVMRENGTPITASPLADTYLAGWTRDGAELICYRDPKYALVSLKGKFSLQGKLPRAPSVATPTPEVFQSVEEPDRAFYLPNIRSFGWSRPEPHFETWTSATVIETKSGRIAWHAGWLGQDVVPSPDGRYLAVFDEEWNKDLWVYDIQSSEWFDLGPLTIYPDPEWSSMKGTWNPWFSDSSRLVYLSGSDLAVSNPDGSEKRRIPIQENAGVPTPSPNGNYVAYLTLHTRPGGSIPGSQVRGGAVIWILPLAEGASPFVVTRKNPDTILDLKWLGNNAVVFDRIENEAFPPRARIWTVSGIAPAQN